MARLCHAAGLVALCGMTTRPTLIRVMRERMRARHLSARTEEAYTWWVRRFITFHGRRHPREMGEPQVREYLTHLAVHGKVASSTQNQALSALMFLYRHVLDASVAVSLQHLHAKRPARLPTVLTTDEVRRVLGVMRGPTFLMASLLYGSGLRLMECCQLRIKDLTFDRGEVMVRSGKGDRDRVTMLPAGIERALKAHLRTVARQHATDLACGAGCVALPNALRSKLGDRAARALGWQWVFPATSCYVDTETGERRRHHLHESVLQKAVSQAARTAGLTQRVTCHTFRHSFATHLMRSGSDIRTVQELMGHRDVRTTMIYLHVMNRGGLGVRSPLDWLGEVGGEGGDGGDGGDGAVEADE